MQPHQQRVVIEKSELSEKIHKIRQFYTTKEFASMSREERNLLELQCDAMSNYLKILEMRTETFNSGVV